MVTEFGKYIRILRVNNDELLGDMAKKLNVSAAFLSRVENGLAKPTSKIEEGIIAKYNLSTQEITQFRLLVERTRNGNVLSLEHLKPQDQMLVKCLAQSVEKLPESDQDAILTILQKNRITIQ